MTTLRPALAIGASLFALAAASLLDVARIQPQQVAASRGDRLNVASLAANCGKNSVIAACAGNAAIEQAMPPVTLVQVFEGANQTTLVKVKLSH